MTKTELQELEDFLRNKDLHLFHPIFSHDVHLNINQNASNGWKVSLQGDTVEDSIILNDLLYEFFNQKNIYYKVATKTRFDSRKIKNENEEIIRYYGEQSHKAMTIYCPDNMDILDLCAEIEKRITSYDGYKDVKTPKNYKRYTDVIYYRNDKDLNGEYIDNIDKELLKKSGK